MFGAEGDSDIPVVLSATRLRQSLADTPASVTIIDRQMIELTGVRELPELLRLVPGMVVGYESLRSVCQPAWHLGGSGAADAGADRRSLLLSALAGLGGLGRPAAGTGRYRAHGSHRADPDSAAYGVNSFSASSISLPAIPPTHRAARCSYRQVQDGISDYGQRFGGRTGDVDWRLTAAGRDDDGFLFNRRRNGVDFTDSKRVDSVYGRAFWIDPGGSRWIFPSAIARMDAQLQYRSPIYIAPPVAERENGYLSLAWDK
jgi:iron complex outermembrane receptor protein